MFATAVRLSKASRAPLSPKRGNKDFYKGLSYFSLSSTHTNLLCLTGTRQAFLPGGHRTGAPGKHVIGGKAKYRLIDEKVRVFVAPPIQDIIDSPVRLLPRPFPPNVPCSFLICSFILHTDQTLRLTASSPHPPRRACSDWQVPRFRRVHGATYAPCSTSSRS